MSEFWVFFTIGLKHVLDIHAYDHVLFLIALTVPYVFKDWKRVLLLVSLFTLGHSISLVLSVLGWISANVKLVEFVIPITILIVSIFNIFTAGKNNKKENISIVAIVTLVFGIVHGLGFSNYFKPLLPGKATDKILPLTEFALGIESAQIIVVIAVLILSYIIQTFFRFSKREFTLVMSSLVLGVILPILIQNPIWNR
jgi:hypothetical protein